MPDLEMLQNTLGASFKNISLLEQSLVHRSYLHENPGFRLGSNERLEFLGDAALGLIVAEKLYNDFPDLPEGEMTRLRALLVKQETLAEIAMSLKLGQYLYLGRGEETAGGRSRPSNMAHLLEAIIGAVFVDRGLEPTRRLVLRWLAPRLELAVSGERSVDYKSRLQELAQGKWRITPSYRIVETSGPDHARTFTVEVLLGEEVKGKGRGESKQAAEMEAAREALGSLEGPG